MNGILDSQCSFCNERAVYDGRTKFGPWAYMCETHFKLHGTGLGPGKGTRLKDIKVMRCTK